MTATDTTPLEIFSTGKIEVHLKSSGVIAQVVTYTNVYVQVFSTGVVRVYRRRADTASFDHVYMPGEVISIKRGRP